MRRAHSSSHSAAAAQARPKSQPPIKFSAPGKSGISAQQTQEEEQHWSKLIEKYDKARGRFAGGSRPMLETLVEHSSGDAMALAVNDQLQTGPAPGDSDDEDEPELSPLTSSASSSSSGSSLASSTLSLSSVSSASTVIGANKLASTKRGTSATTKVIIEPVKVITNLSDEEDHQSSESSSCSSGVSSLSERKASLSSTTSSGSSSGSSGGGSSESLGQLGATVDACLADLVSSVVGAHEDEQFEQCTLPALMVKRIPLESHTNSRNKVEPNQIIGLARRHIFNALRRAQEIGERESSWWVCVRQATSSTRDKNANYHPHAPTIGWHQDTTERQGGAFQVPAREIIDCLTEHELVIWLLDQSNKEPAARPGSSNYDGVDNRRALNESEHSTTTTTSGNLIGVHSELDCDRNQLEREHRHGENQAEAVIWLCSSESDARQVKECWLRFGADAAGASVARSPPPIATAADRCERESEPRSGNESKLSRGESRGGGNGGAIVIEPAAADRDNNERPMSGAARSDSASLRKAASEFDLSTGGTGSQDDTGAAATTGLAGYYRSARSGTNKLIRNLKDEMVKRNSGGGGGGARRVSSVLVVQQRPEPAAESLSRAASSSVCDLSKSQSALQLVGAGKRMRDATTGGQGAAASQAAGDAATPPAPSRAALPVAPPVVKPRTSILKARRDAANADAQAKPAARQQVAAATGGGKCDLPQQQQQQQQQQQERNINRGGRMVSSTSLNGLHQLQGSGAGKKPPRSILKAQAVDTDPGNQLNGSSKCSGRRAVGGAQVVVVSSAAASPAKITEQHPSVDSNEISRAKSIGGVGDGKRSYERKVELPVAPRGSRGGADGARQCASPQASARSQQTLASSSSAAASRRKLVHSLANCEIVARTHQQTQQQHQRARELSLSTSDLRERQRRDSSAKSSGKEIGVESCASKRDGGKREEPTKGGDGGGEDEFVSSGSLAREQAFERLRMRASCYDITRLMSKNSTIQSQLARLRAGGGGGDLRQRKPAELRVPSEQPPTGQELGPERDARATSSQTKKPTSPEDPKRSKRMSMFEQSSDKCAAIKRVESVRCKKPVGGVAVLRHRELADEAREQAERRVAAKSEVEADDISESLEEKRETHEREEGKQMVATETDGVNSDQECESDLEDENREDQDGDSEATIVGEDDGGEVEATAKVKTSTIGRATAGGLSKFNLLRQSFNQKTISSMLKFSSRASLRIGAGKRAPVPAPGPEAPTEPTSGAGGGAGKDEMARATKENAIVVAEPKQVAMATKLPKASKSSSTKHLVDLQQQQQIAAIDSATMMLYNRHMQQRQLQQQQQQQQQQQLLQQQQQYAYQWHQQQQIYIQQHHQRQQLAYMANQYMTTAAHHPAAHHQHLYQAHALAPGAPIAPQAAMGGFAAAASATTSMYAMSAQQPLMMPPQVAQHRQQPAGGSVGSILKKSILKSASSKHTVAQMAYSAGGRAPTSSTAHHPSQHQFIPLSVNHHSSVNIVYGAPRLDNAQQQEEPPVTKIKQPSRANLLGASMRKTVKSILVSGSRSSSLSQQQDAAEPERQAAPGKPLKSALKTSKSRVVPDSIQLNSEGSDGDQSTSSTLESTSSNSSFERDRDQPTGYQPKSVLKKKSSLPSGAGTTILDESPELSSTDESSSSSDNNFKRATSTRCSRRITKSPPKQFEPGAIVASRASIRAPRKNVTFSTKLTSIL